MHLINRKTDTTSDFIISSSYRNRIIYKINKVHITQAMSTDREKIGEAFDSRELILIVFVKVSFGLTSFLADLLFLLDDLSGLLHDPYKKSSL